MSVYSASFDPLLELFLKSDFLWNIKTVKVKGPQKKVTLKPTQTSGESKKKHDLNLKLEYHISVCFKP